jgi:hypothetical protein
MPDRYRRTAAIPGYIKVELILDEELFRWADAYAAQIGASPEAVIEAALKKYRAERDDESSSLEEVAGEDDEDL